MGLTGFQHITFSWRWCSNSTLFSMKPTANFYLHVKTQMGLISSSTALHGTLPLLGSWSLSVITEGQEWNSSSSGSHLFRLCLTQALSVTLSASLKQKEETIRELALLPAFLFFPALDTLVQLVGCSGLCQLARVPRRQSVSEGSYETAWELHFSLCCDTAAVPVVGECRPGRRLPTLGWSSQWGWGTCITPLFTTPNGIKADIHIPSSSLSFWRKEKKKSLNPSIFFQSSSLPFLLQTETLCSTTLIPVIYPIKPQTLCPFYLEP